MFKVEIKFYKFLLSNDFNIIALKRKPKITLYVLISRLFQNEKMALSAIYKNNKFTKFFKRPSCFSINIIINLFLSPYDIFVTKFRFYINLKCNFYSKNHTFAYPSLQKNLLVDILMYISFKYEFY